MAYAKKRKSATRTITVKVIIPSGRATTKRKKRKLPKNALLYYSKVYKGRNKNVALYNTKRFR